MKLTALVPFLAATAVAQNMSACDKYTTALLKTNNGDNQLMLLTLLVNTVVIGNYTMPNHNAVPGILAPGMADGKNVSLAKYFDGSLLSTNVDRKGMAGSINFLDGGGAAPLMMNMPANDNSTNQYMLLTHLYEYFGTLLGCSQIGKSGSKFSKYSGTTSMYEVHRFMDLAPEEITYFITQVGLAASSFGVTQADIAPIAMALNNLFNMRCSPKADPINAGVSELQAMCVNTACPTPTSGAVCSQYTDMIVAPAKAAESLVGLGVPTVVMVTSNVVNGSSTMMVTMNVTEGMGGVVNAMTTETTVVSGKTMVITTEMPVTMGGAMATGSATSTSKSVAPATEVPIFSLMFIAAIALAVGIL